MVNADHARHGEAWEAVLTGCEIAVPSDQHQKIARIDQAVDTDRAEIGLSRHSTVVFADVVSRLSIGQRDAKANAARNHPHGEAPAGDLGFDRQPSQLWDK